MAFEFHTDADPSAVDAFVIASDQNTLYQTSPWAKVKNNWESYFTSVSEDGTMIASALILFRRLTPWHTLAYIPRGPVMNYSRRDLVSFYLKQLCSFAKSHHAIALRFDPDLLSRCYPFTEKDLPHAYENNDVIDYLKSLGAKHKGFTKKISEATQPRFNAAMNVDADWRSRLVKNTRQSIRTAEKRGVEVHFGHEYLHLFAEAMHYTETRQKVALRNEEYFRNMVNAFGDHAIVAVATLNFAHQEERLKQEISQCTEALKNASGKKETARLTQELHNAEQELTRNETDWKEEGKDEVVLCGKLVCFNEKRMEYFYMGNNTKYMRVRANYYLYAKFLDYCCEHHIPYCSFGGIEGTLDDGLTQFKSAWPIQIEEYIGEFNFVLNAPMYHLFDEVYPKLLKTAARIRGSEK